MADPEVVISDNGADDSPAKADVEMGDEATGADEEEPSGLEEIEIEEEPAKTTFLE